MCRLANDSQEHWVRGCPHPAQQATTLQAYNHILEDASLLHPLSRHAARTVGHRIAIGNWSEEQIQHVSDHYSSLMLTEAQDVLDLVQQHLQQMVSDRWDNRAQLIAGCTPTLSKRPFHRCERYFVATEGRGRAIHTSYSAVRLLNAPCKTFKLRNKAE